MHCEVIINNDAIDIDRAFTYKVPEELLEDIKFGQLVKVPFGIKNNLSLGIVISLNHDDNLDVSFKVKKVKSIENLMPIITEYDLELINFIKDRYLCTYIDVIRLLIPAGILSGNKFKSEKVVVFIKDDLSKIKNKDGYLDIINFVKKNNGLYNKSYLGKIFSIYKVNKLIEINNLDYVESIVARYNSKVYKEDKRKKLNVEQENVVNGIINSSENIFMIKGVTGSGKTEVYMRIAEKIIKDNKSVIILVPEIVLTPQMIERFKGRFGVNVALFHSKLSKGERFDEWFRVKNGSANIVVGARSALFLPVKNLGLIIIDEEHESSYKSDKNPKYNTKEVAEFIAKKKSAKLILGSATPTIENYYRALSGDIKLFEIKNRVNNQSLPITEIIDMREELKSGNKSLLSRSLYNNIKVRLQNKEQIILFLNKRGFSSFVSCRSCGYVFKCNTCDISMTYHKNGFLVCHYCGKTQKQDSSCPKCKSKYIKFFGAGTQKVELEIKKYFKDAKILRLDVDTTRTKDSFEKIYNDFKYGDYDILIGTQMVSKGLDFERVTLVGVLAADMSINIPDFRSSERTFQLLTQVSGRAGRGEKTGNVIIQTYTPNHYSIEFAKNHDYEGFYEKEFMVRAMMKYPPFSEILLINVSSLDEEVLKKFMLNLKKELDELINLYFELDILGPIQCLIGKIKDRYRWQIIVKGEFDNDFLKKVKNILYQSNKNNYNEIRINIDINPSSLM